MKNANFNGIGFFAVVFAVVLLWISASSGAQVPPTALIVDYGLTHVEENSIEPGDSGNLVIVIQNTGGFEARGVKAYIADTSNIKGGGSWALGDIVPGRSVVIKTTIKADKDAYIGTHEIPLFLSYTSYWISDSGAKESKDVETNWAVPVHVSIKPLFVIEDLSVPEVAPGDKFKLGVNLRNDKTDAFDVSVKLNLYQAPPASQKITVIGSGAKYAGVLNKSRNFNSEFELYISDDAKSGAYTLPLNVDYEDSGHNKHSDSFTIGIYVSGDAEISITDLKTYPEKIYAEDENVEVKISLENQGKGQIKNLKLILKPESPFNNAKSYEQTKNIGLLNSGDKTDATFYVNVDKSALPGKYSLNFLAEYTVNDEEINESTVIPVFIEEKPLFKISYDAIKTSAGEKKTIKIKVRNTGEECDSVKLWVMEKSDQPFSFDDKTDYIGDLGRNEEGEGILKWTVKDDAKPKSYIVPVEIRCVKGDTVLVNSDKLIIEVSAGERSYSVIQLGLIILAVIAAVLLIMKYRRWSTKK